jgi:D-alanine-D-alanine ligase
VAGAAYVLKTLWEHASFGLDEHSIVRPADEAALSDLLRQSARRLRRPCFAERYVEGREFNLSVLAGPDGPEVLPAAEIDFSAFPPGKPRIVGRRAKWEEASFDFQNTPRRFDFVPGDALRLEHLRGLARQAWQLFGLGGYARVDFRVDAAGQPWILEINANPCLSPDAGFAAALAQASIPFAQAVARILDDALRQIA